MVQDSSSGSACPHTVRYRRKSRTPLPNGTPSARTWPCATWLSTERLECDACAAEACSYAEGCLGRWDHRPRHFPSSCFHIDTITEFLESSGHLLVARDTDIIKIEPLALSYWEFTLSGCYLLKINLGFPCICIQIIFFSSSLANFVRKEVNQ